jgi:hypothetical protein
MFYRNIETVWKVLDELVRSLEETMMIKLGEMLISVKWDYISTLGENQSTVSKCLFRLILNIITDSESYFRRLANIELEGDVATVNTEFSSISLHFLLSSSDYSLLLPNFGSTSTSFNLCSPTYNPISLIIGNSRQYLHSFKHSSKSPVRLLTNSEISNFTINASSNKHQLAFLSEAKTARFGLLRSLFNQPIFDQELHEIYQIGDQIISDTAFVLNDLKGWL